MELPKEPLFKNSTRGKTITLPHDWTARDYQIPTLAALDSGFKNAVSVWHRRAGKDSCAVNYAAGKTQQRIGTYWHVLPTQRQARKVIWEYIDKQGRRVIDQAFPKEIRKRTRDDDMMIELKSGSIFQLVGGDNYDANVGANPIGITWSEYSITDPRAADFVRPILAENSGWQWYIFTPRGKNHAYKLYNLAKKNPEHWFVSKLSVLDTGAIPLSEIEQDRIMGKSEEHIQQEYYCSFDGGMEGAIYNREMSYLEAGGRITSVPYDRRYPVETWWDIGHRDATSIVFVQRIGNEVRFIDYYEKTKEGLPHFANVIHSKGYAYSRHVGPHDLAVTEWGSNATRVEQAAQHGIQFIVAPKLAIDEGISAVRSLLYRVTIDATKCSRLIEALGQYHREYDDEKDILSAKPTHDWTSHGCDAVRTGAVVPEGIGILPDWAKGLMQPEAGPWAKLYQQPIVSGVESFDPLAEWRNSGQGAGLQRVSRASGYPYSRQT